MLLWKNEVLLLFLSLVCALWVSQVARSIESESNDNQQETKENVAEGDNSANSVLNSQAGPDETGPKTDDTNLNPGTIKDKDTQLVVPDVKIALTQDEINLNARRTDSLQKDFKQPVVASDKETQESQKVEDDNKQKSNTRASEGVKTVDNSSQVDINADNEGPAPAPVTAEENKKPEALSATEPDNQQELSTPTTGDTVKEVEIKPDSIEKTTPPVATPDDAKPNASAQPDPTLTREAGDPAHPLDEAIDAVALSEKHDMPAFEDWKKELYENEKKGTPPVYEAENPEQKPPSPKSTDELRNYASNECGAKVISSSKDARNTQSVLNENKDEYVMQPCNGRKWFTIELCQPVLIRRIEMANLELFSSTFENFTVAISKGNGGKDRVGKEWLLLGTFRAKEERNIQIFNAPQLNLYTRFVKIDILSHHGNEHFCPVTIIRVFGHGLDDDDDDDDSSSVVDATTQPPVVVIPIAGTNEFSNDKRVDSGSIFPPQPVDCFKCFDKYSDIPIFCSPELYEVLDTVEKSHNSLTDMPAAKSPDGQYPCNKTASTNDSAIASETVQLNISSDSKSSDARSSIVPAQVDLDNNTHVKVKPSQPAVLSTSSQDTVIPTPTVDVTPTPSRPVDGVVPSPTASIELQPTDIELILPSPPTLAEPPTVTPPDTPPDAANVPPDAVSELSLPPSPEDQSATGTVDEDTNGSTNDPPPPAPRIGKRYNAISKLSNQVKGLEQNLQVTNRYLEEMSKKYKNQKEELQKALNVTMRALQNATKKITTMEKEYLSLKEKYAVMSEQMQDLQAIIDGSQSMGVITPVIIFICLLALMISSCKKVTPMTKKEVEEMLATLPPNPQKHRRSGSDHGTVGYEKDVVPISALKKCASVSMLPTTPKSTSLGKQKAKTDPDVLFKEQNSEKKADDETADVRPDCIEIITPTTWRTYDTPDSKDSKGKAKRRKSHTSKAHRRIIDEIIKESDASDDGSNKTGSSKSSRAASSSLDWAASLNESTNTSKQNGAYIPTMTVDKCVTSIQDKPTISNKSRILSLFNKLFS